MPHVLKELCSSTKSVAAATGKDDDVLFFFSFDLSLLKYGDRFFYHQSVFHMCCVGYYIGFVCV